MMEKKLVLFLGLQKTDNVPGRLVMTPRNLNQQKSIREIMKHYRQHQIDHRNEEQCVE